MLNLVYCGDMCHVGVGTIGLCGQVGQAEVDGPLAKIISIQDLDFCLFWFRTCAECIRTAIDRLQQQETPEADVLRYPLYGFKTVSWNARVRMFCSASATNFIWPPDGRAVAECRYSEMGNIRGYKIKPHKPGFLGCSCGIYASTTADLVCRPPYVSPNSALILVSGEGEMDVWDQGFRAEAVQVEAVVRSALTPHWNEGKKMTRMNAALAAKYFDVPLVTERVAMERVRDSWLRNGFHDCGSGSWAWRSECQMELNV